MTLSVRRSRVAHVTSAHPPYDNRIYHKECKTLAEAGYDVVLIARFDPNFRPDFVHYMPITPVKSRLLRMLFGPLAALLLCLKSKSELFHLHDPELIPIGLLLRCLGCKVILDVHEDLPKQIDSKEYLPAATKPLIRYFSQGLVRLGNIYATRILTATPAIAKNFSPRKTQVLANFPRKSELYRPNGDGDAQARKIDVLYIGYLTRARGCYQMLDAGRELSKRMAKFRMVIGGPCDCVDLATLANSADYEFLEYLPWVDRDTMGTLMSQAKLGLVLFHPDPNHTEAQPNKLFEYMSAGIPVIASHFPLWQDVIDSKDCGLTVDPLDVSAICHAAESLINDPEAAKAKGARGRAAVEATFNWEQASQNLIESYQVVLSST